MPNLQTRLLRLPRDSRRRVDAVLQRRVQDGGQVHQLARRRGQRARATTSTIPSVCCRTATASRCRTTGPCDTKRVTRCRTTTRASKSPPMHGREARAEVPGRAPARPTTPGTSTLTWSPNTCKNLAVRAGRHARDDELEASILDERGYITALTTKSGRKSSGDLFIDCSGFRALLDQQGDGRAVRRHGDHLLCDSAVATAVPNDDERTGIEPYTSAIAMTERLDLEDPDARPLRHGIRVFQQVRQPGRSGARLLPAVGARRSKTELNKIRFRVGRNRRAWVKNCVEHRPVVLLPRAARVDRHLLHLRGDLSSWPSTSPTSVRARRSSIASIARSR